MIYVGMFGCIFFSKTNSIGIYWYSQFFKNKSDFIEFFLILSQEVKLSKNLFSTLFCLGI
jgi:hypothetical protein